MTGQEFTTDELRVIRRALMALAPSDEAAAPVWARVVNMLTDRAAVQHMIATGQYPTWYTGLQS